jgi:hypothetical protein
LQCFSALDGVLDALRKKRNSVSFSVSANNNKLQNDGDGLLLAIVVDAVEQPAQRCAGLRQQFSFPRLTGEVIYGT